MYDPVLGVLRNFKQLISEFGFIPNGTRKYYSKRSQPPFFGPMVRSVSTNNNLKITAGNKRVYRILTGPNLYNIANGKRDLELLVRKFQ